MDLADLSSVLRGCGVSDEHVAKLTEAGWTIELFAASVSSPDTLEAQLPEMLEQGPGLLKPLETAAFRLAWQKCVQ